MSDEMNALNEYRASIQRKKERFRDMSQTFRNAAEGETDVFKRTVAKAFAQHATIMEDIFDNIEMTVIANSGLKSQNELLRDIIVQLPEVKSNPQIQKDVEKTFGEYNELYKKQQESFKRHRDDLGL